MSGKDEVPNCMICQWSLINILTGRTCGSMGFQHPCDVWNTEECKKLYKPKEINEKEK